MISVSTAPSPQVVSLIMELDEMGGGPIRLGCGATACIVLPDVLKDDSNSNNNSCCKTSCVQVLGNDIKLDPDPSGGTSSSPRIFEFDVCVNLGGGDQKLHNVMGKELLCWLRDGFNASVVGLGQMGSSSAAAMFGTRPPKGSQSKYQQGAVKIIEPSYNTRGLLLDVIHDLMNDDDTSKEHSGSQKILLSCWQLSGNITNDLLDPLQEHSSSPSRAQRNGGLKSVEVTTFDQALFALQAACDKHAELCPDQPMHPWVSSCSHVVVQLQLYNVQNACASSLTFICLAGFTPLSEQGNISAMKSEQVDALRRLTNQQLQSFVKYVSELASQHQTQSGEQSFVPSRDSKLTSVLSPLISCNTRLFMMCTVTPYQADYLNTSQSLKVCMQAKSIKMPCTKGSVGSLSSTSSFTCNDFAAQLKKKQREQSSTGGAFTHGQISRSACETMNHRDQTSPRRSIERLPGGPALAPAPCGGQLTQTGCQLAEAFGTNSQEIISSPATPATVLSEIVSEADLSEPESCSAPSYVLPGVYDVTPRDGIDSVSPVRCYEVYPNGNVPLLSTLEDTRHQDGVCKQQLTNGNKLESLPGVISRFKRSENHFNIPAAPHTQNSDTKSDNKTIECARHKENKIHGCTADQLQSADCVPNDPLSTDHPLFAEMTMNDLSVISDSDGHIVKKAGDEKQQLAPEQQNICGGHASETVPSHAAAAAAVNTARESPGQNHTIQLSGNRGGQVYVEQGDGHTIVNSNLLEQKEAVCSEPQSQLLPSSPRQPVHSVPSVPSENTMEPSTSEIEDNSSRSFITQLFQTLPSALTPSSPSLRPNAAQSNVLHQPQSLSAANRSSARQEAAGLQDATIAPRRYPSPQQRHVQSGTVSAAGPVASTPGALYSVSPRAPQQQSRSPSPPQRYASPLSPRQLSGNGLNVATHSKHSNGSKPLHSIVAQPDPQSPSASRQLASLQGESSLVNMASPVRQAISSGAMAKPHSPYHKSPRYPIDSNNSPNFEIQLHNLRQHYPPALAPRSTEQTQPAMRHVSRLHMAPGPSGGSLWADSCLDSPRQQLDSDRWISQTAPDIITAQEMNQAATHNSTLPRWYTPPSLRPATVNIPSTPEACSNVHSTQSTLLSSALSDGISYTALSPRLQSGSNPVPSTISRAGISPDRSSSISAPSGNSGSFIQKHGTPSQPAVLELRQSSDNERADDLLFPDQSKSPQAKSLDTSNWRIHFRVNESPIDQAAATYFAGISGFSQAAATAPRTCSRPGRKDHSQDSKATAQLKPSLKKKAEASRDICLAGSCKHAARLKMLNVQLKRAEAEREQAAAMCAELKVELNTLQSSRKEANVSTIQARYLARQVAGQRKKLRDQEHESADMSSVLLDLKSKLASVVKENSKLKLNVSELSSSLSSAQHQIEDFGQLGRRRDELLASLPELPAEPAAPSRSQSLSGHKHSPGFPSQPNLPRTFTAGTVAGSRGSPSSPSANDGKGSSAAARGYSRSNQREVEPAAHSNSSIGGNRVRKQVGAYASAASVCSPAHNMREMNDASSASLAGTMVESTRGRPRAAPGVKKSSGGGPAGAANRPVVAATSRALRLCERLRDETPQTAKAHEMLNKVLDLIQVEEHRQAVMQQREAMVLELLMQIKT